MRTAIEKVEKHFPTAIISGISRDKVYEFVALTELYYAGSHGMDIMGPVTQTVSDYPNCFKSIDKQVYGTLVESTKGIEGAKVENNKFCVSVNYRNVDEKSWNLVAQCVHDIFKDYPRLKLTHGHKYTVMAHKLDSVVGTMEGFSSIEIGHMVAIQNPYTHSNCFPRRASCSLLECLQVIQMNIQEEICKQIVQELKINQATQCPVIPHAAVLTLIR